MDQTTVMKVQKSAAVTVSATVGTTDDPNTCTSEPGQFAWTLTPDDNAVTAPTSFAGAGGTSTIALNIKPGVMVPGNTYQASITGTFPTGQVLTDSTSIEVKSSKLAVSISQGSAMAVQRGTNVALRADVVDPDGGALEYQWATDNSDIGGATTTSFVVDSSSETAGTILSYKITVTRTQGAETVTAEAAIAIQLLAVPVPDVTVQSSNTLAEFPSSEYLALYSQATLIGGACTDCTYQWTLISGTPVGGKQLIDNADGGQNSILLGGHTVSASEFVIQQGVLARGETFVFRCTVTTAGGDAGYSEVTVPVNLGPPTGGTITIAHPATLASPTEAATGTAAGGPTAATDITISATGYTDTAEPLYYSIGYCAIPCDANSQQQNPPVWIVENQPSTSTVTTKTIPVGQYKAVVVVQDALGAKTDMVVGSGLITITLPTPPQGTSVQAMVADNTETTLASIPSGQKKAQTAGGLAKSMTGGRRTLTDTQKQTNAITAMAATLKDDFDNGASVPTVASTLATITADTALLSCTTADKVEEITTSVFGSSQSFSQVVAQQFIAAMDKVEAVQRSTPCGKNLAQKTAAAEAKGLSIGKLKSAVLSTQVPGGPAISMVTTTTTVTTAKLTKANAIAGTKVGAVNFGAGTNFGTVPGTYDWSVVGLGVVTSSVIPYDTTGNIIRQPLMLSVTVRDNTNTIVPVTNLNVPASIDFGVATTAKAATGCSYWDTDTDQWSNDGLSVSTTKCQTTHFTDFVQTTSPNLVFTRQPVGATGGLAFATQPEVTIQDPAGGTVTSDSSSQVTLSKTTGSGTGTLSPSVSLTATAAAGVVSYTGVTLNTAGSYTLTATATIGGETISADSASFQVNLAQHLS